MSHLKFDLSRERLSEIANKAINVASNGLGKVVDGAAKAQEMLREKEDLVNELEQLRKLVAQANLRRNLINADGKLSLIQAEFEGFLKDCGATQEQIKELGRRMFQDN